MRLEDLKLYQECLDFEKEIWDITNSWDGFQRDTLGKPIIQSADAISGNIAQGYGRYNFKDKKHYCYISRGYILKTRGWLMKAKEREMIDAERVDELLAFNEKIHRMLNAYIRSIGRVRDENTSKPYHTDNKAYRTEDTTETNDGNKETDGNVEQVEKTAEPDGNSFTANADEFFSSDELNNS